MVSGSDNHLVRGRPMAESYRVTRRRPAINRVWRSKQGVATLEFALVGVVLMSFLIGIMEVGRYMLTLEAVRTVTADAVRLAMLRGSASLNAGAGACSNLSGSLTGANARTPLLRSADLSVILSGCATNAGMTTVRVTVTYPFTYAIPLVSSRSKQVQEIAQAVIN
jgi:Flp pilus assembly protein TadG